MTSRRTTVLRGACTVAGLTAGAGYWTAISSQSQLFGHFPNGADSADPLRSRRVALTFDDGPNEPYTSRLLELLYARGVRATFFQVGRAVERFPDATVAATAGGHVIGNHTYHHDLHRCFTRSAIDDEVRRGQEALGQVLGTYPALYRPPWLLRTPATFSVLARHGLAAVSGTFCHPLEVAQIRAARIADRTVARTRPGRVIIFHDGYNGRGADRTRTLDAVARTVDALAERGWSFVTVDELLGVPAYRPASAPVPSG